MAQAGRAGRGVRRRASHDTDVKVFGGEVESLSVAEVEGVGVRLLRRPPPGLRVGRLARPGRRGRDGRRSARQRGLRHPGRVRSGCPSRPTSTASPRRTSTSGATSCSRSRPRRRSRSRSRSRRRRARPTRGCAASSPRRTATARSRSRSRARSASRRRPGARCARSRRSRWPAKARRPRPATGSRSGARSSDLDVATAARDAARAVDPPARRAPARVPPAPGRSSTRSSPGRCSALLGARAQRRGGAQGPLDVRRTATARRSRPRTSPSSTTRRYPRRSARRPTTARACPPAGSTSIVDGRLAGLPPQRVHGAPLGGAHDRLRGARLQVDARRSARGRCT